MPSAAPNPKAETKAKHGKVSKNKEKAKILSSAKRLSKSLRMFPGGHVSAAGSTPKLNCSAPEYYFRVKF